MGGVTSSAFPYRLGKKRVMHDPRTLKLSTYLRQLPPPPPSVDWTQGITNWGMLGNDRLGDCTCAAAAHAEMVWSRVIGTPRAFTDDQVINLYNRVNGGADDGAVELFVLREWHTNGLTPDSRILAYASVQPADVELVKTATSLFAGVYIGVALPISAQAQAAWDVAPGDLPDMQPGSWGGHAVNVVAYDPDGLTVVTWGALKRMTWAFWSKYVEEAWAILPADFEKMPAAIPGVLDFATLQADIAQIGSVNP